MVELRGNSRKSSLRERAIEILPGQYFDAETGLHQNWHRDYDPSIGRYLQSDPIGLEGGLNTYGYVGANPLKYIDPEGLAAKPRGGRLGGTYPAPGSNADGSVNLNAPWVYNESAEDESSPTDSKSDERSRYHQRCDEKTPPHLTGCDRARWELQRAKDCKSMRESFADKWHGGKYDSGHERYMEQLDRQIARLQKYLSRECGGCD